jgi:hypothetical protein
MAAKPFVAPVLVLKTARATVIYSVASCIGVWFLALPIGKPIQLVPFGKALVLLKQASAAPLGFWPKSRRQPNFLAEAGRG